MKKLRCYNKKTTSPQKQRRNYLQKYFSAENQLIKISYFTNSLNSAFKNS